LQAIKILRQDVIPRQLNLTIDPEFDLQAILRSHGSEYIDVPDDCGLEEAEQTWRGCERVVDALVGSHHLKSLCVRFVWPFEKCEDGVPRDRGAMLENRVIGGGR
jgi:hypothetical protein